MDGNRWEPLEVVFPEGPLPEGLAIDALREVLAQDPRPRYQEDPEKVYGMDFGGFQVRFRVEEGIVHVLAIESNL